MDGLAGALQKAGYTVGHVELPPARKPTGAATQGPAPVKQPKTIVVGISGASGAAYARRTIELLVAAGTDVHLVVSPLGQRLLHDELGMEGVDLDALAGTRDHSITLHHYRDVGAAIASGSFRHDGMVVVPCSNHSLAAIANGLSDNLMHRAASVSLKERRPLIIAHRETPLGSVEIGPLFSRT